MILLQATRGDKKIHDHQITFARIPFQRIVTEQIGSKLFPRPTIIFTLELYYHIIIFPSMIKTTDYTREIKLFPKIAFSSPNNAYLCISSKKNLNFKFRTFSKKNYWITKNL